MFVVDATGQVVEVVQREVVLAALHFCLPFPFAFFSPTSFCSPSPFRGLPRGRGPATPAAGCWVNAVQSTPNAAARARTVSQRGVSFLPCSRSLTAETVRFALSA